MEAACWILFVVVCLATGLQTKTRATGSFSYWLCVRTEKVAGIFMNRIFVTDLFFLEKVKEQIFVLWQLKCCTIYWEHLQNLVYHCEKISDWIKFKKHSLFSVHDSVVLLWFCFCNRNPKRAPACFWLGEELGQRGKKRAATEKEEGAGLCSVWTSTKLANA